MKPIWKGSISFGLVNIPVELYSAVKAESLGFKLLHKNDHGPITYKRVCSVCNKEVGWEDIVKGYKLPDGSYFIISPEALEKMKPKKTNSIDIVEFVNTSAIEPVYYEHHYYVAPLKNAEKAFSLLLKALDHLQISAIGQFVLRDKAYVSAIKSYKNCLLLSTLNYDYEIKPADLINTKAITSNKVDPKELKLAEQLINKLYVKKFDISIFEDTFTTDIMKEIQGKGKKSSKVTVKTQRPREESLLDVLKASLAPNIIAQKTPNSVPKSRSK